MSDAFEQDGFLRLSLSTWIYKLHGAGVEPDDEALVAACRAVDAAESSEPGDAAGWALVRRVGELVGEGDDPAQVEQVARRLYGERVDSDLGQGDRSERTARIRKYQFGRSLPWLARIWERKPDGSVGPSWLLVEQVTDEVTAMDPNPWNDIDEERHIPVSDFHVLWELDACTSLSLR